MILTVGVYAQKEWDGSPNWTFLHSINPHPLDWAAGAGYVYIATTEISFPEPTREEWVVKYVATLRAKIDKVQAEAGAAVNTINEEIQTMLAIAYDDSSSSAVQEPGFAPRHDDTHDHGAPDDTPF